MNGILPKRIAASQLQCAKCVHFRDDDPDVYYCDLDCPEFAGLCERYQFRNHPLTPTPHESTPHR